MTAVSTAEPRAAPAGESSAGALPAADDPAVLAYASHGFGAAWDGFPASFRAALIDGARRMVARHGARVLDMLRGPDDDGLDLQAEFEAAYARITPAHEDALAAARVPTHAAWTSLVGARVVETEGRALLGVGPISETAATGAETGAVGAWEPAEQGKHAIIVPVGITHGGQWWAEIHDLVAFRLAEPGRWWLRTGEMLLGAEHAYDAIDRRAAVTLVATPLDWLRLRGDAVCVLDWTRADPRVLFHGAERVECCTTTADGRLTEAPELAATLRRRVAALTKPGFTVVAGSRSKDS